jgi:hypothetical protein
VVAADSLLVVATDVVQAANDKQQLEPMVEHSKVLPEELGKVETLLADNGYFSAANVTACATANIEPLTATGREPHHPSLTERFAAAPSAPQNPTHGSGHGTPAEDAGGQEALCAAQASVSRVKPAGRLHRCSASSSRCWASGSSSCVGWIVSAASGAW